MDQLFAASVGYCTSRGAAVAGHDVRGKTGTTNDSRDAWFAGWSGGLAAVVWMGNDDFSPTQGAVGGAGPARIFARFIEAAPAYPASLDALLANRNQDPIASLLNADIAANSDSPPSPAGEPADEPDPIAALLGRIGEEAQSEQ